jgi:hypothetical protein
MLRVVSALTLQDFSNPILDCLRDWRELRLSVSRNAADAHARRLAKEAELNAINHGVAIAPQNGDGRVSLASLRPALNHQTRPRYRVNLSPGLPPQRTSTSV